MRPHSSLAGHFRRAPPPDRCGLRAGCGLIVETGEAREVHHFCCLLGLAPRHCVPWLALASIDRMADDGRLDHTDRSAAISHYMQGGQQRHPQSDVENGHLHPAKLPGRPDLRMRGAVHCRCGPLVQGNGHPHSGGRYGDPRPRDPVSAAALPVGHRALQRAACLTSAAAIDGGATENPTSTTRTLFHCSSRPSAGRMQAHGGAIRKPLTASTGKRG
jgi:hypothetical protein